jgi:hypothetical protein
MWRESHSFSYTDNQTSDHYVNETNKILLQQKTTFLWYRGPSPLAETYNIKIEANLRVGMMS